MAKVRERSHPAKGDDRFIENRREATIEKYQDKKGEWRWRLRAPNGRIMADSAEGYSSKANVEQAIRQVIAYIAEGYDNRLKIVTYREETAPADPPAPGTAIDISEQIRQVIIDQLTPGKGFDLSWRLVEGCGADSLDLVEIIMAVEDTFIIEIPDEDAEGLLTGQDIVDYVVSKGSPASPK